MKTAIQHPRSCADKYKHDFAQWETENKNRDEKSSLFVFYKIFAKPITEVSFVCFSFRAKQRKIIRRTENSHFMKI